MSDDNPLSPENVGTIQFIMLARIYDLLMIDLNERNPEVANRVAKLHQAGTILGPAPVLNGDFVFSRESETTGEDEELTHNGEN